MAQNKKKAQANKQRFRDNRDKYVEEMRQAFKLMQAKEREESGFRWVKRPKRDVPAIPLHDLRLGGKHDGVVITVKEHGAYVDFGATRDGFVRLRVRGRRGVVWGCRVRLKAGFCVFFGVCGGTRISLKNHTTHPVSQ